MAAIGGSIQEVSIRGRTFAVPADVEATLDLGGFTNEIMMNGNGTSREKKERKAWMTEGLSVEMDPDRGDLEFLQEIADGTGGVVMTVTLVTGQSYRGKGTLTGDIKGSTQNAVVPITLSGGGKMELQ